MGGKVFLLKVYFVLESYVLLPYIQDVMTNDIDIDLFDAAYDFGSGLAHRGENFHCSVDFSEVEDAVREGFESTQRDMQNDGLWEALESLPYEEHTALWFSHQLSSGGLSSPPFFIQTF